MFMRTDYILYLIRRPFTWQGKTSTFTDIHNDEKQRGACRSLAGGVDGEVMAAAHIPSDLSENDSILGTDVPLYALSAIYSVLSSRRSARPVGCPNAFVNSFVCPVTWLSRNVGTCDKRSR